MLGGWQQADGNHVSTTDPQATFSGGTFDGVLYYLPAGPQPGAETPLLQTHNPVTGDDMDALGQPAPGYQTVAVLGYPYSAPGPGLLEIVRKVNRKTGDHVTAQPDDFPDYRADGTLGYGIPRFHSKASVLTEIEHAGTKIGSNLVAGGALWEWREKDFQFLSDYDYGRQIQCAIDWADPSSTDGAVNPTEAGSTYTKPYDFGAFSPWRQGSVVVSSITRTVPGGKVLTTESIPLEWMPERFGGGQDSPVLWTGTRLRRTIEIGERLGSGVAAYTQEVYWPAVVANAIAEAPTGYMVTAMNRFYTYDATADTLTEVFPPHGQAVLQGHDYTGPGLTFNAPAYGGVLISTPDQNRAMGIAAAGTPAGGPVASFDLYDFTTIGDGGQYGPATTKWGTVCPQAGTGWQTFRTHIVTGTVADVQSRMHKLYTAPPAA